MNRNRTLTLIALAASTAFCFKLLAEESAPSTQPEVKSLAVIEDETRVAVIELQAKFDEELARLHQVRLEELGRSRRQAMLDDDLNLANQIQEKIDEATRFGPQVILSQATTLPAVIELPASDKGILDTAIHPKSIVFYIDATGSVGTSARRRSALMSYVVQRLDEFDESVSAAIVFLTFDDEVKSTQRLLPVTPTTRNILLESIRSQTFSGQGQPAKSLNSCFQLNPEQIIFITDGQFSGEFEDLMTGVKRGRAKFKRTRFDVVLLDSDPDAVKSVQPLTDAGGGEVIQLQN